MPTTAEVTLLAIGGVAAYALLRGQSLPETAGEAGAAVGAGAVGLAAGALDTGYDLVADNLGKPLAEAIAGPPPTDAELTMLTGYDAADRTNAKASGTRIPTLDVVLLRDALPLERAGQLAAGWANQRKVSVGFLGLDSVPLVEWTLGRIGADNVLDGPAAAPSPPAGTAGLLAGPTTGAQQ